MSDVIKHLENRNRPLNTLRQFLNTPAGVILMVVLVWIGVFATHFSDGLIMSTDSKWSIYTTLSILREGNTDLDEYADILAEHEYYAIETVNGHFYTRYPLGASLLALPIVWGVDALLTRAVSADVDEFARQAIPGGLETLAASMMIACASVIMLLIARLTLRGVGYPLLLVCVFAFCTAAWSTGSRALWQHGPSMLVLALAFYLLLLADRHPVYAALCLRLASLPLAFSYLIRPTNAIVIGIFALVILVRHRRHFLDYCLWSLIVAVPFVVFNRLVYGSILSPYYTDQPLRIGASFFEALAGNLISPARGLLIYSPILLLIVYGIWLKIKQRAMTLLDYALLLIITAHWLAISSFTVWWGGHSVGSRYFSDITPLLVYFLIPVLQQMSTAAARKRIILAVVFLALTAGSFWIQYRCVHSLRAFVWNFTPDNIDEHPDRLWDWGDVPFLRPNYVFVDEDGNVIHR